MSPVYPPILMLFYYSTPSFGCKPELCYFLRNFAAFYEDHKIFPEIFAILLLRISTSPHLCYTEIKNLFLYFKGGSQNGRNGSFSGIKWNYRI